MKKNGHVPIFLFSGCGMDIQTVLETTLNGLGYELVDFELSGGGNMRIFMDKPGGVTVEDCAQVSNHLTRLFLVEEIDYSRLEVSSPGLDRPLKKESDFVRFTGQLVKLKLRLAVDGQKKFIGRISTFNEGTLTLDVEGKPVVIEFSNIDKARLEPEFNF